MKAIRAISLYQPWATLIGIGVKPDETRSWATTYRGPLLIHAGKNKSCLDAIDLVPEIGAAFAAAGIGLADLPFGAFVCTCDLVDCRRTELVKPNPFGNFEPNRFSWLLGNVRILPEPIPAKGQQGFWVPGSIDDGGDLVLLEKPLPTYYGAAPAGAFDAPSAQGDLLL